MKESSASGPWLSSVHTKISSPLRSNRPTAEEPQEFLGNIYVNHFKTKLRSSAPDQGHVQSVPALSSVSVAVGQQGTNGNDEKMEEFFVAASLSSERLQPALLV